MNRLFVADLSRLLAGTGLLAFVVLLSQNTAANESHSQRGHSLLLDDRIVKRVENAQLTLGHVTKHPANPLMVEDRPWEKRFDNLYANVLFDRDVGHYRCWYGPFIVDHSARSKSQQDRQTPYRPPSDRQSGLCYAISKDGLVWEKPLLGLVEYKGSKENNIIARGPHGVGVFRDPHSSSPDHLFKQFFKLDEISVAFSADGLHWSDYVDCPEIGARGDTHNNSFWAPTLSKYVGITREKNAEFGRLVARTESDDFIHWSPAEVVLHGNDHNLQTYAMPTFYHGGVYLGLLMIHDQQQDRVWTELAWSPDTKQWHRICPGVPLIPNSDREGDYDWGCVYAAATPVIREDEIRIYYGGSDGLHFGWRCGSLNLATLRPDGFAGYTQVSEQKPAIVTTTPIRTTGRLLALNADVSPSGFVEVAAIDAAGNKIAQCRLTKSTTGEMSVLDVPTDAGMYRLRFEFSNATVYSFRLRERTVRR
ncbi:hypothetical protein NG895_09460 [Aeoliella sp. ICT_H6.2]|uniref:Uncharacterized protein n=1 Tax=Aeoliella straminimaris TaxID=2954799 RepID=A0A9X2FD73_9BACT|nr:hypothetical protein [Aeoliella straminimaris]MCO6044134.1 hypothetical protein [Aeoliella straminimaris]